MAVVLRPARKSRVMPKSPMTYEQFLDWADEDTLAEWVDGEVELMSPASAQHQRLAKFLLRVMEQFVEENDAGEMFMAPFQMKLDNVRRGREPDLLFLTKEHLGRLQRNFLDGPADIAIEIISPESGLRDRGAKYGEYEAGGVREYWILDADERRADFFVLGDDGRHERARPDADGVYRSAVLRGFRLNVGWLWQAPLPKLRHVLREWEAS